MVKTFSIIGGFLLACVALVTASLRCGILKEGAVSLGGECLVSLKDYCVIDLRGEGGQYDITYLDAPPEQGWGFEHKTEKLVLRLIRPGRFKFRGRYEAEITKPYYIGVYEVTCRQYSLIIGEPVECQTHGGQRFEEPYDNAVNDLGWGQIRGNPALGGECKLEDIDWPRTRRKDPRSILARLESRTGKRFDLPTEFQWEYACGSESDADFVSNDWRTWDKLPGKCRESWTPVTINGFYDFRVGSRAPNARGLYDMHGNVSEWCLDVWDEQYVPDARDAVGSSTADGLWRIVKGGCIWSKAEDCVSTAVVREGIWLWGELGYGFRVVMDAR